jgi:nucleotide-binding universal stress UspA family protein
MIASSLTRRIVIPLDGSDIATVAIPYLRAVATSGSAVVLLRVVQWQLPLAGISVDQDTTGDDFPKPPLAVVDAYLKAIADELEDVTADTRRIARPGEAVAEEILEVIEESGATMIIMATRGRGALGRALIGSIADRIARASPVPVLLIHPELESVPADLHSTAAIRRLVVPLDGSERALAALPVAAEVADNMDLPVHLMRAVPTAAQMFSHEEFIPIGARLERMVFAVPVWELSDRERTYHQSYTTAADEQLAQAAGRLRSRGIETTTELVVGAPVPSIMATLGRGDLVVMTSRGAGGIRRWQLGSVAEKLIHQAAAPILLVPDAERS